MTLMDSLMSGFSVLGLDEELDLGLGGIGDALLEKLRLGNACTSKTLLTGYSSQLLSLNCFSFF